MSFKVTASVKTESDYPETITSSNPWCMRPSVEVGVKRRSPRRLACSAVPIRGLKYEQQSRLVERHGGGEARCRPNQAEFGDWAE